VDADIEGFFDHVDHQIMMDLVCEKIADGRVLSHRIVPEKRNNE